jgi:hypothetical protein
MQATLDMYGITPDGGGSDSDEPGGEYLFDFGELTITCFIYLYRCAQTGYAVYVGQTRTSVDKRDAQHLRDRETEFDRAYTDGGLYTLHTLESRVFVADVTDQSDDVLLLTEAQLWMNDREKHWVTDLGTYSPEGHGPGMNQTPGGQGDCLVSWMQACRRRSHRKWRDIYIPAFERWQADNPGLALMHIKQDAVVQCPNARTGTVNLGQLVHSLRTENTTCPARWRAWLDARGFAWDYNEAVWERINIPALERWQADNPGLALMHVRRDAVVQCPNAPTGTVNLGHLVIDLRAENTTCPARWRAWLDARGFAWDYTEAVWERINIPAFERYMINAEVDALAHVPRRTRMHSEASRDGYIELGKLVDNLRTGRTTCPARWRAWLNERGFLWHTRNMAKHVAGTLGAAPASLPVTAAGVAGSADVTATLSRLYGTGTFGGAVTESLVEIEARYLADRARL